MGNYINSYTTNRQASIGNAASQPCKQSLMAVIKGQATTLKEALHRGLGEGVRNFRPEIFFSKNGFGGSLGSHWKVFHHGTLRNHFQGVVVAFGSWPGGEKGAEIRWKFNFIFLALKCPICVQS